MRQQGGVATTFRGVPMGVDADGVQPLWGARRGGRAHGHHSSRLPASLSFSVHVCTATRVF